MKSMKIRGICAAVTGALMFGFGANAMADSSVDIVNALVAKGVLTEEEGALITKGAKEEKAANAKAIKKAGKVTISDAIDNATVYGDVRVRYEDRSGDGIGGTASVASAAASTTPIGYIGGSSSSPVYGPSTGAKAASLTNGTERRERARYKITMGVKTNSGDWYSDVAFAMGANGRSDNATFGSFGSSNGGNNINNKEALYVKRAMLGYKATDWLTLEAGRMENPLYTTQMVWDADITWEGLAEKAKYKLNDNLELFGTAAQMQYLGDKKSFFVGAGSSTTTNELLAFQGGVKYNINDRASAKIGITDYYYTHGHQGMTKATGFNPGTSNTGSTNDLNTASYYVNDLDVIEVPFEMNYMATPTVGVRFFGDYAVNTSADSRAQNSGLGLTGSSGSDDTAWMLGLHVGSAKDLKSFEGNKMVAGDWSARLWYQEVGVWALDQNGVDSDMFDSRINMKGTTFKAQYNVQDNVLLNFAIAHADRKNDSFGTPGGAGGDISLNLSKFDVVQFDVTYKF